MTTLVLSVVQGPAGSKRETRHVSSGRFEIGRAPGSDWVLDDPHCHVSKRHCVFRQDEQGWSVADVSRNGSFLASGAARIRLGAEPHRLSAGERLGVGPFEFAVDFEDDEASFRAVPLHPGGVLRDGSPVRMPPPPDLPAQRYTPSEATYQAEPAATRNGPPTRMFLASAAAPARSAHGLASFLEGASLAPDDVVAPGREAEVLRAAGAALRATVAEIRRLRLAMLGEPNETPLNSAFSSARPLAEARSERDALRCLLSDERRFETPIETVIEASFSEFRQHHDCLVRAARRSARSLVESLDPDAPERVLMPRWYDVLPGMRRARGAVLARRRYRRLRFMLDRAIDEALARAYLDIRREADARWRPR